MRKGDCLTILQTINLIHVSEDDSLRQSNFRGFACQYLAQCNTEFESDDEVNIEVFTQLLELDSLSGKTTATEQLFHCLHQSLRLDLVKVSIQIKPFKFS